jgi:hypothetical protein
MDFIIRKDIYGSWWHDYNNNATKVSISDFECVIDEVANTFIIQNKNGSNVPSKAVSIADVKVIDQNISETPIAFSGAVGLQNLLTAKQYPPYRESSIVYDQKIIWRKGHAIVWNETQEFFNANFDSNGLGINLALGWGLCNGNGGRKDFRDRTVVSKGANFSTLYNTGGSANAVLIGHKHKIAKGTADFNSVSGSAPVAFGTNFTIDSESTGLSENGASVPDQTGVGKNMPPYIIAQWVERVSDLIVYYTGSEGGGAVDSVNGQTGVVIIPLDYLPLAGGTMDAGADIFFDNGSALREGTYDFGANGGISRICSVDYEDMWQAGIRHVFDNNGLIRHSTNCFDVVPDSSFDNTLRFKVDSLWTLDNGTTYKCTDASTGAAVWEIYHNFIPNLTQVLTVGDKEFQQIDGDRDFELADRLKYSLIVGGMTMTLDDDLDLFPNNSLIQFFVANDTIPATATLNITAGTGCYYLSENITTLTLNVGDFCELKKGSGSGWILNVWNKSSGGGSGTVTSVGLTMPSAFTVTNSPITSSGDIAVTGAGAVSQYVRGDGSLANFPTSSGGGSSLSFYLNGSVSQGTFGGVAFKEMDRTPILGAGTDFTINANGYIQSFITDAGVPNLLEIPAGNWNFETYFSASSGGGSPSFYVELYKWDGATLSLIASSSANPEFITGGTNTDLYVSALAVPQTTLLATDRLAVRIYVTHSGRTIKLHTEDNHLCQVITTFSTGLTALNGLTAQVQNLATGTTGTDFGIVSSGSTHTFNLPTASATNRGALSSADWTTFNNKQNNFILGRKASASSALTGTTAETILESIFVPAGSVAVGDVIYIRNRVFKTGGLGGFSYRYRINSSNSISGSSVLGLVTLATGATRSQGMERTLNLRASNTVEVIDNTASIAYENSSPSNANANITLTFTSDFWILITATLGNASDSIVNSNYIIQKF